MRDGLPTWAQFTTSLSRKPELEMMNLDQSSSSRETAEIRRENARIAREWRTQAFEVVHPEIAFCIAPLQDMSSTGCARYSSFVEKTKRRDPTKRATPPYNAVVQAIILA